MYINGWEETGRKYHNEAKEKMKQLLELAEEIYKLSYKEADCCVPGARVTAVSFSKDSLESNQLNKVASKYGLKF